MKNTNEVLEALRATGREVVSGKGGFFVKGEGFISLAQARKLTGIQAPKRAESMVMSSYGDWATIAMFNTRRK
jgi:hypothetical protein